MTALFLSGCGGEARSAPPQIEQPTDTQSQRFLRLRNPPVPEEDDLIDELYNQVFRELHIFIIANPFTFARANYLLWAAHNLERVADRVINICGRVIYIETGQMKEIYVSDDEKMNAEWIYLTATYEP